MSDVPFPKEIVIEYEELAVAARLAEECRTCRAGLAILVQMEGAERGEWDTTVLHTMQCPTTIATHKAIAVDRPQLRSVPGGKA